MVDMCSAINAVGSSKMACSFSQDVLELLKKAMVSCGLPGGLS